VKNKKVPDGPKFSKNHGVNWPTKYVPIQSENPAIDMAKPRILVGYISDNKTKITAEIEIAVKKIYARKRINMKMDGKL
jgi:hypothetical protein